MSDARASWFGDATRWIATTIDALGIGPCSKIDAIREQPWGAVLRVETSEGALFFKAEGPGATHEPTVVADIAGTHPRLVPDLLAVDLDRAWLLMPDNGTPMRDSVDATGEIAIWEQIYPTYADMQRVHVSDIQRWIEAGTPDRRLHLLPEQVERLLADEALPLERERRRAVEATLPDLIRVCEELDAPPAIDHSDMHKGNVLVGRGTPRLVDWGDACITHPFVSMFVTFQHAVAPLPASDRPAVALRLRDAYLEPWGDVANLRPAFAIATWLGHLIRALNFIHQLGEPSDWGEDVARFLVRWQEQRVLLGRGDELILAVANEPE
jgi:hypothetical protein